MIFFKLLKGIQRNSRTLKKTALRIMDKEGEQSQVISVQKQSHLKSWKENLSDKRHTEHQKDRYRWKFLSCHQQPKKPTEIYNWLLNVWPIAQDCY